LLHVSLKNDLAIDYESSGEHGFEEFKKNTHGKKTKNLVIFF
jgi:hypothetical protein